MKNLKSFLFNLTTALLGIFTLIFLSQGYVKYSLGGFTSYTNGYDLLEFDTGVEKLNMTAISLLIVIILVSIILLISIINILKDFNAFKTSKNFGKIMTIIELVLTGIVLAFSIVGICCLASFLSELGSVYSIGWAFIINLIISVALFAVSIFKILTIKKK